MAKEEEKKPPQGMLLEAVFASEAIDSSGEIAKIDGMDITDLEEGLAEVNFEHKGGGSDAGSSGLDWVGRVVYAKKIFSEKDCSNERQLDFWRELELPYLYGIVRLYDAAGHAGAQALAAIIRDHNANKERQIWRWSVEGTTTSVSPDKKILKETIVRAIALTRRPCNKSAETRVIRDPQAPEGYETSPVKVEKDWLEGVLERSEHIHPERRTLSSTVLDYDPVMKAEDLQKTITAGSYNAAPSTLTGGAALQVEDPSLKLRRWSQMARKSLESWDGKADLKAHLKHELPEASSEFVDRFTDLVNKYQVGKKNSMLKAEPLLSPHETLVRKFENWTVSLNKAAADFKAEKEQAKAVVKPPMEIHFRGRRVRPGKATFQGKQVALLHGDEKHLYGVPMEKLHSFRAEDLLKLPRKAEQIGFTVDKYPAPVNVKPVVDAAVHGTHFNTTAKQNSLIHGLDLSKIGTAPKSASGYGVNEQHMNWHTGPKGKVVVKADAEENPFGQADREALFHNLAHNFFGLGEHVPTVAHFAHPHTGVSHVAIEQVKGEHPATDLTGNLKDPQQRQALIEAGNTGKLDKMAMMDAITGVGDRHEFNWMMDRSGKPMLIDHGSAFEQAQAPSDYWHKYHIARDGVDSSNWTYEPLHPSAKEWINGLDPAKLQAQMQKHGAPEDITGMIVDRLTNLKNALAVKPELSKFEADEIGGGHAIAPKSSLEERFPTKKVG